MAESKKILVLGLAKSGTTALFSKIAASLSEEYKSFFEPSLRPTEIQKIRMMRRIENNEKVIVKDLVSHKLNDSFDREYHQQFDKKILIIRDPRDIFISSLLFRLGDKRYFKDTPHQKKKQIIQILKSKRLHPEKHPVTDLITQLDTVLSGKEKKEWAPYFQMFNINRLMPFLKSNDFFVFRYEDMIDEKFGALEGYLGFKINAAAEVADKQKRVVRTKGYGSWKNWFTPEDVERLKPRFDLALGQLGYEKDWELHKNQVIQTEHCDGYVHRLWDNWTFRPEPPKIAIITAGIPQRSINFTGDSIKQNLIAPLEQIGKVNIFYHAWDLPQIDHLWGGEKAIKLDFQDFRKNFPRARGSIGNQATYLEQVEKNNPQTLSAFFNYIPDQKKAAAANRALVCFLRSLELAFQEFKNSPDYKSYDLVLFARFDVEYTSPIPIPSLPLKKNTLYLPGFGSSGGYNDRFAYGDVETMELYCNRNRHLLDWIKKEESFRNSECYLEKIIDTNDIGVEKIRYRFDRIRSDGANEEILKSEKKRQKMVEERNPKKQKVVLVACARNEGPYLLEWVCYHRLLGFDEIHIYSHDDDDGSEILLEKLEKAGLIQYTNLTGKIPEDARVQYHVYSQALKKIKKESDARWMCAIDIDEFIVVPEHDTIQDFISTFPADTRGILLQWKMFNSNEQIRKKEGLVIDRFTSLGNRNRRSAKTIAKITEINDWNTIHTPCLGFVEAGSVYYADQTKAKKLRRRKDLNYEMGCINHYVNKSYEEFLLKMMRGSGYERLKDINNPVQDRTFLFERHNQHKGVKDQTIFRTRTYRELKPFMQKVIQENNLQSVLNDTKTRSQNFLHQKIQELEKQDLSEKKKAGIQEIIKKVYPEGVPSFEKEKQILPLSLAAESPVKNGPRTALAACARNEGPYLLEWVCYHKLLGFDEIYIYSHDNTDGSDELLQKLEEAGLIQYRDMTGKIPKDTKIQTFAYKQAFQEIKKKADWMCVIDLDEFIILKKHKTIVGFLQSFPSDTEGIVFNWNVFNSSGQITKEPGLVLERFTELGLLRKEIKTIAKISKIFDWDKIHSPHYKSRKRKRIVRYPDGAITRKQKNYFTDNVAVLNHYIVKSYEEFITKIGRGRGSFSPEKNSQKEKNPDKLACLQEHNSSLRIEDQFILKTELYQNLKPFMQKIIRKHSLEKILEGIEQRTKTNAKESFARWKNNRAVQEFKAMLSDQRLKNRIEYLDEPNINETKTALVACARNEGPYLLEWVCYHKLLGFDEIYIYSHDNDDGSDELLQKLDQAGLIHYRNVTGKIPEKLLIQNFGYSQAFEEIKKKGTADWMCVIDLDEFVVLHEHDTIQEFLESFPEDVSGIVLFWKMFNSGGQWEKKEGLVTERFTNLGELDIKWPKTIARISHVKRWRQPHFPAYKENKKAVFSSGNPHSQRPFEMDAKYLKGETAVINHYFTKSYEEFLVKMHRGSGLNFVADMHNPKDGRGVEDFISSIEQAENKTNKTIQKSKAFKQLRQYVDSVIQENDLGALLKNIDTSYKALAKRCVESVPDWQMQRIKKTVSTWEQKERSILPTTSKKVGRRIYQIGFNKSGTTSLHKFFLANGIKSIHWDEGQLAERMFYNYANKRPLFEGYEGYEAFTDMEYRLGLKCKYAAETFFRQIYREDPDGLFILNIRPVEEWVASRKKHERYLEIEKLAHGMTEEEVCEMWRKEYQDHIRNVRRFFINKENWLIFDISKHGGERLTNFLNKFGFQCSPEYWKNYNKKGEGIPQESGPPKIRLILPYFGAEFPSYFQYYLDSISRSKYVDLLLITDLDTASYRLGKNIAVIQKKFQDFAYEVTQKIKAETDLLINLENPSKFKEFQPLYGCLFNEYLKGYSHWACGNVNVIYGDLDTFLKGFEDFDVVGDLETLTIIKKETRIPWKRIEYIENLVRTTNKRNEIKVFTGLVQKANIKYKNTKEMAAHLLPPIFRTKESVKNYEKRFLTAWQLPREEEIRNKNQFFLYEKGKLTGYLDGKKDKEYIAIQFKERNIQTKTSEPNIKIVPNKIVSLELNNPEKREKENKHIFIGGMHRSGTSMMHQILKSQCSISGFTDTKAIQDEGQYLILDILPHDHDCGTFTNLGYSPKACLNETSEYATPEVKQKIMNKWGKHWDFSKEFLVEKTPTLNLLRTRFLQELFPGSYFLMMMRHPIAQAYGLLFLAKRELQFTSENLEKLIKHWVHCYGVFEKDRKQIQHVKLIKYEEFVQNPKAYLSDIFHFLGNTDTPNIDQDIYQDTNDKYFKLWQEEKEKNPEFVSRLEQEYESAINQWGYSFNLADPYRKNTVLQKHPSKIKKQLIFIHIPKAAGSLIRKILENQKQVAVQKHLPPHKPLFASEGNYENCFIFTSIRNPWDRLVSAFFHLKKANGSEYGQQKKKLLDEFNGDFQAFVKALKTRRDLQAIVHFLPQMHWKKGRYQRGLDFIVSYENLEKDLEKLSKITGIPFSAKEKVNTSNHKSYTEYYDSETKGIVSQLYKEDIEVFGYSFEGGPQNIVDNKIIEAHEEKKTLEVLEPLGNHKHIFIGGMHRSGTSIMHMILRDQPNISGFHATGVSHDEGQHLIKSIIPNDQKCGGVRRLGYSEKAHLTEDSRFVTRENREKILAVWNQYWDGSKKFLIEKTPALNLLRMRFWQKLFPGSYFVILMRHPVACSYALLRMSKGKLSLENLEPLLHHWVQCHKIYERDAKYIKHLKLLRYEEFVRNPKRYLQNILKFIGNTEALFFRWMIKVDTNSKYFDLWSQAKKRHPESIERIEKELECEINKWGYSFNLSKPYLFRTKPRLRDEFDRIHYNLSCIPNIIKSRFASLRKAYPSRVLILGTAKTGTTGLFFRIKQNLPRSYEALFEPYQSMERQKITKIFQSHPKVLVKDIRADFEDLEMYRDFEKKILVVRDPRDRAISWLLYQLGDRNLYKVDAEQKREKVMALLLRKRQNPSQYPFVNLLEDILEVLFPGEKEKNERKKINWLGIPTYEKLIQFIKENPEYKVFKYESFVDEDFQQLEKYLEFTLDKKEKIENGLQRVVRTKAYENWKNWLTPHDVDFLKELYNPFLCELHYKVNWQLEPQQHISPEHIDTYVLNLWDKWTFKNQPQIFKKKTHATQEKMILLACARNEGPFLLEWVCYHKLLGFDEIHIYSHDNEDGSDELLNRLDAAGLIHYHDKTGKVPPNKLIQSWLYSTAFQEIPKTRKDWLCVIDLDEFIVLKEHKTIQEFIKSFPKDIDGVAFNWQMFNSNQHWKKSNGLVIDRFTQRGRKNPIAVKTIARCGAIKNWFGAHHPLLKKPKKSRIIYPDGTPCVWRKYRTARYHTDTNAVVHHYVVKSYEEFLVKMGRGGGGDKGRNIFSPKDRKYGLILRHNEYKGREDNSIQDMEIYSRLKSYIQEIIDQCDLSDLLENIEVQFRIIAKKILATAPTKKVDRAREAFERGKIKKNKPLKFIHITKTAGTSIEDQAKKHKIFWGRHDPELRKNTITSRGCFWHAKLEEFEEQFIKDFDLFAVVRNPYERVISEVFSGFRESYKKSTIEDFNAFIQLQIQKERTQGGHWVPQSEYVFDRKGNKQIRHVIKYENLYAEFNTLMKAYKLPVRLDETKVSNKSYPKEFGISDFYPETIELINKYYDQDFKNFGYSKISSRTDIPSKDKICLIIPYFGKEFPSFFQQYLDSLAESKILELLLFTDISVDLYTIPKNVQVVKKSYQDFCTEVKEKLQKLELRFCPSKPYEICKIRPLFGLLFAPELKNYSHWGFGDLDVIYGNMDRALKDFSNHDVIIHRGPFTALKNNQTCNNIWKGIENLQQMLSSSVHYAVDETFFHPVIREKHEEGEISVNLVGKFFADILAPKRLHPRSKKIEAAKLEIHRHFFIRNAQTSEVFKDQYFVIEPGKAIGYRGGKRDREYSLLHLGGRGRLMTVNTNQKKYAVIPNKIIDIDQVVEQNKREKIYFALTEDSLLEDYIKAAVIVLLEAGKYDPIIFYSGSTQQTISEFEQLYAEVITDNETIQNIQKTGLQSRHQLFDTTQKIKEDPFFRPHIKKGLKKLKYLEQFWGE